MKITRRQMIAGGAAAAALAALPGSGGLRSAARAAGPRRLVMVLNFGGWDTTYALDPKPGASVIDVPEGELRMFGNIPIWTHASRPAVDGFFERWGDRAVVINGVQVRSFVHADCIKRVMTGSPSETTPDMGAVAAYELAPELPVPYLALGPQARSGPLAAITGRTGTTNQIMALVDPEQAYAGVRGFTPDPGLAPSAREESLVQAFLAAGAERMRATRGQRGYNRRRIEDFVKSLERADRMARFVRDGATFGAREYTLALDIQVPLAVQALRDGLSHTALLQSGYSWDTHTVNVQQSEFHQGLYGSLDALMTQLEESDLLEDTMVMVFSEMGRTPKLNEQAGKDHWPVTSCMFLGAGVRGNRVLGGTTDELGAMSLNLETGALDARGNQLQSANLVAGVLDALGVDTEAYLPGVEAFRGFA